MKKINLAITGCLGRMGQQLIKSVKKNKNFKLVAITENKIVNKKINGLKINLNKERIFKDTDLIIDFTIPKCTFQVLKMNPGETFHITPGLIHRFCAYDSDVKICEVSTPHLSDVVRLEDDYSR